MHTSYRSMESSVCLFICVVYTITTSDVYDLDFLEQLIMARTHMNPYNSAPLNT